MKKSLVFKAASEGAAYNSLIALAAGTFGRFFGAYGPSILQASGAIALGMYLAEEKAETAIAVTAGGLMTAAALGTAVAARQLAAATLEANGVTHEVVFETPTLPHRPGWHIPQALPTGE